MPSSVLPLSLSKALYCWLPELLVTADGWTDAVPMMLLTVGGKKSVAAAS
jgi:hypothetical protein